MTYDTSLYVSNANATSRDHTLLCGCFNPLHHVMSGTGGGEITYIIHSYFLYVWSVAASATQSRTSSQQRRSSPQHLSSFHTNSFTE